MEESDRNVLASLENTFCTVSEKILSLVSESWSSTRQCHHSVLIAVGLMGAITAGVVRNNMNQLQAERLDKLRRERTLLHKELTNLLTDRSYLKESALGHGLSRANAEVDSGNIYLHDCMGFGDRTLGDSEKKT